MITLEEEMKKFIQFVNESKIENISEALEYHVENNIPLAQNIFRMHSENFYQLFNEARELYKEGKLELSDQFDIELLETNIGMMAEFEGESVPLDLPITEEEDRPPLGKPRRGGPKKFYVYVKKPDGGIKKVTFGDTTGLSVKMNNPEARKSFVARHGCGTGRASDRTKAAYWSCNLPRYAKSLGLSGGGNFFW